MILRLLFCIFLINVVLAEWDLSKFRHPVRVNKIPEDFNLPFYSTNDGQMFEQPNLVEVTSNQQRCYPLKTMMKMVRGLLAYLTENPNKVHYLHHLVSFINDDEELSSGRSGYSQMGEVVAVIERDEKLTIHEKKALREVLDFDIPPPNVNTNIVFKYEIPQLQQPQCKDVFMKLMEVAHDSYIQLAQYPMCQGFDIPNNIQPPEVAPWDVSPDAYPSPWEAPLKPEPIPEYIIPDAIPDQTHENQEIEDWIAIFPNKPFSPEERPDVWPEFPGVTPIVIPEENPSIFDSFQVPDIIDWKPPVNDNIRITLEENVRTLLEILEQNRETYTTYHIQLIQSIVMLVKSNQSVPDHKLNALIEVILPFLMPSKNVHDTNVIQILVTLLKPVETGVINPKIIDLLIELLKLSRSEVHKPKFTILISLLRPSDRGEVHPTLIEIINYLLKIKENTSPNYKVIRLIISFLTQESRPHEKNIEILLSLLKLNNHHQIPERIYQLILEFLVKINEVDVNPGYVFPNNINGIDGKKLAQLLAQNPSLIFKLFGQLHLTPNVYSPGIIELTYLLKHPKPFVYQPFYYVKYRLPLITFLSNVKNLLLKYPHLNLNPIKLYQDLITISNVTEISPNLKGYTKDDILKLTVDNGALFAAKILDEKFTDFKEQMKLVQDINAETTAETVMSQSDHIFSEHDYATESQMVEDVWSVTHSESSQNVMPSFSYTKVPDIQNLGGQHDFWAEFSRRNQNRS